MNTIDHGCMFSWHLEHEHPERWKIIKEKIGFGYELVSYVNPQGRKIILSTTGILMVKIEEFNMVITAYPANMTKAKACFEAVGQKMPKDYGKIIIHNRQFGV